MENPDNSTSCKSCGATIAAAAPTVSSDVKKCSYCSKPLVGEDAYYFKCRYCGQDFCYEHRLPENHLCKSSPLRRNIPNTASGSYYSTGGGYWASTGKSQQKQGGFSINISKQGRNLAIAIGLGLVIGGLLNLVSINYPPFGIIPLSYFLVQTNAIVYTGSDCADLYLFHRSAPVVAGPARCCLQCLCRDMAGRNVASRLFG